MEEVLKCTHEEADVTIFFHVNDGIKRNNFTKIVVASPDRCPCKCSLSFYSMNILWFRRTMGLTRKIRRKTSFFCS